MEWGGILMVLFFFGGADGEREGGPPYSVKVELYETLLAGKDGGFTLVCFSPSLFTSFQESWCCFGSYLCSKVFQELPEKTTHPDGKETMCVWRRDWAYCFSDSSWERVRSSLVPRSCAGESTLLCWSSFFFFFLGVAASQSRFILVVSDKLPRISWWRVETHILLFQLVHRKFVHTLQDDPSTTCC